MPSALQVFRFDGQAIQAHNFRGRACWLATKWERVS
jgi:hypothetical protein